MNIALHKKTTLPGHSFYTSASRRTKLALDGIKSGDGLFGRQIMHEAVDRAESNSKFEEPA
jgi:hypothetical protein